MGNSWVLTLCAADKKKTASKVGAYYAGIGRYPVSYHRIQPEYGDEQAYAGRDCRTRLARPNRRRERGHGNIIFTCSADHEQDWQPYPADPYSCYM